MPLPLLMLVCWVQAARDTHSPEGARTTEACGERPVVTLLCCVYRPGMSLTALQELGLTFDECDCECCLHPVRPWVLPAAR